jgi:hypothetical protein
MAQNKSILIEWISWHFFEMPKFLFEVWMNYFAFATNVFSFTLLLKTFFAPWRRFNWGYPKSFDIVEYFNIFVSNIFSRILGAIMRMALIVIGFLFQIFVAIAGLIVIAGWILLPLIIIFGILLF